MCFQFMHPCQYVQRPYQLVHIPLIANVSTRCSLQFAACHCCRRRRRRLCHIALLRLRIAAIFRCLAFVTQLANDCIASTQSPFLFSIRFLSFD